MYIFNRINNSSVKNPARLVSESFFPILFIMHELFTEESQIILGQIYDSYIKHLSYNFLTQVN